MHSTSVPPTISPLQRNLNAAIDDQQARTLGAKAAALAGSTCGLRPASSGASTIPEDIARLQRRLARLRHKMPPLGLRHETYEEAFADPAWWASRTEICPICPPELVQTIWCTIRQIEQQIRELERARRGVQRIQLHPRRPAPIAPSLALVCVWGGL